MGNNYKKLKEAAKDFKSDVNNGDRWMECLESFEQHHIDRMMEILMCKWGDDESRKSAKPHKCPVCEGSRYNKQEFGTVGEKISIDGVEYEPGKRIYWKTLCSVCEGEGIVWG